MGSDVAEHVVVGSHGVVVHKQLTCEGFVIEVAFKAAHRPFEVVALADDVPCEVLFAVPFSAVGFLTSQALRDDLEVVEFVVKLQIIVDGLLTVVLCRAKRFAISRTYPSIRGYGRSRPR